MKYEHFAIFAAAMIEDCTRGAIGDNNSTDELTYVEDIVSALREVLQSGSRNRVSEQRIREIANDLCMDDYIETYADDESRGELQKLAKQYL